MKKQVKYFSLIFALTVLIIILSFQSNIAQSKKAELAKLAESSEVIVIGKVADLKSSWNENKTRIYTRVTINAEEYIMGGNNNESLVLTVPGGEIDDVGELYTHMPRFKSDEEVIVFAKKDKKDNKYKVVDGENGKISLIRDKVNGERVTASSKTVKNLKEEIKLHLRK